MSNSQKVLRVFGFLEIVLAVLIAVGAIRGGSITSWLSVIVSLLLAYLLLAAAKDASKIGGAWWVLLLSLIISVLDLVLAITGDYDAMMIVGIAIVILLNLIAFIAANNVKKQAR